MDPCFKNPDKHKSILLKPSGFRSNKRTVVCVYIKHLYINKCADEIFVEKQNSIISVTINFNYQINP